MGFEEGTELVPLSAEQELEQRNVVLQHAPEWLARYEQAATVDEVFYFLPKAALAAWLLEKFDLAEAFAGKVLELAPGYTGDWNFGNAICTGHNILGLLALHDGQTEEAIGHLHKAGETPGSPQLNSFGPSMQLARALARKGEFGAALRYLDQCRVFWSMGGAWLDIWERRLQAGAVPNFFGAAYR